MVCTDYFEESLKLHKKYGGKIAIESKVPLATKEDLSLAYTPGVAQPSREIAKNHALAFEYTMKKNSVAVVSDGSAVLGLGNVGAEAAIPVMEGKAILFKKLAGIDAFPICIKSQDPQEIVSIVKNIAPAFGGINLEDIAAPKCFEIEEKLQDIGIPVMHDDQHGTAIVVLAGLLNASRAVGKSFSEMKVVVSGSGAAGTAITKMLLCLDEGDNTKGVCTSVREVIMVDSKGIIHKGREDLNAPKAVLANHTNKRNVKGSLVEALNGADAFIGVSAPGIVTREMISGMNENAIVFAMANPTPEIMPDEAKAGGARIVATGRSDYPNQVNNALAFPGVFRGALDSKATRISIGMKLAAAYALATCISEPAEKRILPDVLDSGVATRIAGAVGKAALEEKLARK